MNSQYDCLVTTEIGPKTFSLNSPRDCEHLYICKKGETAIWSTFNTEVSENNTVGLKGQVNYSLEI